MLLLLVPLLAGCSIGDVRRKPPTPSSRAAVTAPSPSAAVAEVRRVRVVVPQRYDPPYVEFVDAEHGYALFANCGEPPPGDDCPARLFATDDGGRSWRELRHPHPAVENHQLYAAPVAVGGDGGILLGVGLVAERRWTKIILDIP